MKRFIQISFCFGWTAAQTLLAQHYHLNAGAQSQAQGTPLFFQNADSFVTNSGFVMPLNLATNGTYAGYYSTALLTPTAIGTGFFDPPAPGTQVRLRFTAASGPAGGSFGVWDSDGSGAAEALTFSLPVGTTNGLNSILLSENNGEPGADPFGHIHGRVFSASEPGLYVVTVQAYDASANGPGGGPIHQPSSPLPIYFQAGLTIASFSKGSTNATLNFAAALAKTYFVQSTTNLADTNSWQDIGDPIIGDNHLHTLTDSTATAAELQRFYRLRVTMP